MWSTWVFQYIHYKKIHPDWHTFNASHCIWNIFSTWLYQGKLKQLLLPFCVTHCVIVLLLFAMFSIFDTVQTRNPVAQPTQRQMKVERMRVVLEACNKSNSFRLVQWDFPLSSAYFPLKTRYGRPQRTLVLCFFAKCHCHWWEGKGARCFCPPVWYP